MPPRMRYALAAAVVALQVAAAAVRAAEPTVPVPRGFVSDYAGVLDAATVSELDKLIGELKAKTGAEIAVVVVKTTQPLAAVDYAMKIAEAWKPGAKDKDNGIVFLSAIEDRELYILTGYGVEGALPDGRTGEIRDRLIVPAFRRGDYAGGIRAATQAMAGIIAADAGVTLSGGVQRTLPQDPWSQVPQKYRTLGLVILVLSVLLFMWLSSQMGASPLSGRRYRRWDRYGGGFGGFGGGFGGGGGGGGFGGFGGGGFGGGGAGGKW